MHGCTATVKLTRVNSGPNRPSRFVVFLCADPWRELKLPKMSTYTAFYKDERCIRANKILLLRMAQVTHGTFVPIILLLVQRAHRVLHKGSNVKSHHPKCPKGDLTSTTGLCSARSFRRTQLCDDATKRLKYTFYLSDKCAVYTTGNHVYV